LPIESIATRSCDANADFCDFDTVSSLAVLLTWYFHITFST
jgi:hypothetical protein